MQKQFVHQIDQIKEYNKDLAQLFTTLLKFTSLKDFSHSGDMINSILKGNVNIDLKISNLPNDGISMQNFLKIGFLMMMFFASFMMNFYFHRKSIKFDVKKISAEYDVNQNTNDSFIQNQNVVKNEKIEDDVNFDFKNQSK